jgi:hypothetical protein
MAIEKTTAIAHKHEFEEDWDSQFAWALPEGHVLIDHAFDLDYDPADLGYGEYAIELTHAPECEALAYFCEQAGVGFVPAKEAA